jgi:hypothetical protein
MSGRESGHRQSSPGVPTDPDTLEVSPGAAREELQGWIPELASEADLLEALERAFDYRGDVLLTLKDKTRVEGYVFDRRTGASLGDSFVRVLLKDGGQKTRICYAEIAGLAFTGRDMAAGKTWESWVRQYWEKKAAGEQNISLKPEPLE